MPDEYSELTLNPDARPYDTYADCPESAECDYCGEGWELDAGHTHEMYENREGAAQRTADELADVFLDAAEWYAAPWRRPEYCPRDVVGWCEDADDSQALSGCIALGESALGAVGLSVTWDDGYVIERVTDGPTLRAAQLGTENGTREAREWIASLPDHVRYGFVACEPENRAERFNLPEPRFDGDDVAGMESEWLGTREDWSMGELIYLQGIYSDAFTAAVKRVTEQTDGLTEGAN